MSRLGFSPQFDPAFPPCFFPTLFARIVYPIGATWSARITFTSFMVSPEVIDMTEPRKTRPASSRKKAARESHRSRKGCPECRQRKIKCDEKRPECSQCLKSGRECRIIDGLFRHHSFSFSANSSRPDARSEPRSEVGSPGPQSPGEPSELSETWESTEPSQPWEKSPVPVNREPAIATVNDKSPLSTSGRAQTHVSDDHHTVVSEPSSRAPASSRDISEETRQDQCEIAFFLRHFADQAGCWMDVFSPQRSYFSQYIVSLASQSALVRYAACAMAAKQLGQMKNSSVQTGLTPSSAHVAAALTAPGLDFLWYGAKYYEKAILILAKEISHGECSACGLSPGEIYRSGFVSPVPDHSHCDEPEDSSAAFRILAACILCQYEDISATMRAWTGHLDGIQKLFRRYLDDAVALPDVVGDIPQSTKALQTSFWFFALHDVLNGFTLRQPCRLDAREMALWHKMGLPLDDGGHLIPSYIPEHYIEEVFFKALIRVLCKMVSWDLAKPSDWAEIDSDLTEWYALLPPPYIATISQPLPPSPQSPQYSSPQGTFSSELWFGMDMCAIAMAFYHMARILLLVNQPRELLLSTPSQASDLLSAYNALQRNLHSHATSIVSISSGTANDPVRKYMIQPLYIAGRCLTSQEERQKVISLLVQIEDDLGLFTEYRRRELSTEWGVAFDG